LILCDDFLNDSNLSKASNKSFQTWLQAYQEGWQVINLCTLERALEMARVQNLHLLREENLTPYLRLRALPSWLARLLLRVGQALPSRHAILPSMLGSMALQQCLQMGIIQYRFLVLEKTN